MTNPTDDLPRYLLRLADDALVLGQRLSEWTSRAPTLEEDIATSNIALDFLGRARMLYSYAGRFTNTSEDDFAFLRDARQFSNLLIYELPRGDYAFTATRQYFVDVFDQLYFALLAQSADRDLAAIAAKSVKEVGYHLRRSRDLLVRLGDGTEESHKRMQVALDELWGYRSELFAMDALETRLHHDGIAVDRSALEDEWLLQVQTDLDEATLLLPEGEWQVSGGREGNHSEHLGHMLDEMQCLHRSHPGAEW